MLIRRLAASLATAESYRTIAEMLGRGDDATLATPGLVRPAVTAALHSDMPRPTLVVVAGEEAAERYWRQTAAFLGREWVLHYPDRTDLPWGDTAPDLDQVGARARALYALDKNRPAIVVASARALLRTVPPQGSRAFDPLVLGQGGTLDLEEATERLARMGYERV
jgi:transcription-repair coupling factor (superfamily II helicase)